MAKIDLKNLTIDKLASHMRAGDFSCREVVDAYLENIEKNNKNLNVYLEIFDDAQKIADGFDEKKRNKGANFLFGVPLAVKDNMAIKGKISSCGSKMLENYHSVYDSTVVRKLKSAGAIFLGRTNMDEFAMGSSTESSAFGPTKNPIDITRVPGGSSGGSAAAVAADMALAALGSDTGGSVRQPAALCGIVGLKTTYGSVSRYGLIAMGSSLDQIGPLTKTVKDAEIIFEIINGYDPLDSTSVPNGIRQESQKRKTKNKRIGVPREFVQDGIDKDILDNFNSVLKHLSDLDYEIVDVKIPTIKYSLAAYYIIMPAEVSSNLARFDGVKYGLHVDGDDLLADYFKTRKEGFGQEVRRRIILGTYILSSGYYDAYYQKAAEVRKLINADFNRIFNSQDGVCAIATPTAPSPAFKIGEKISNPLSMYLQDIFTVSANVAGIPGISVPSGFVKRDGVSLPVGFQLLAPHFKESTLFDIGKDVEKLTYVV